MIVKEKKGRLFFDLIKGDTLIENENIKDGSVDLILTDLPFGTMKGLDAEPIKGNNDKNYVAGGGYKKGYDWDAVIEPKKVYEIANRILRKNGKMILFCQELFTTQLINKAISNVPFNYRAIWEKNDFANCLFAKKAMVNYYEDVLVFSKMNPIHDSEFIHPLRPYFKLVFDYIGLTKKTIIEQVGQRADHTFRFNSSQFSLCTRETYEALIYYYCIDSMVDFKQFDELVEIDRPFKADLNNKANSINPSIFNLWEGNKYKSNILKYKKDYDGHHPTQKPVLLLEDLIKTFSNENDLVVDLTMGSGSTGVACKNTGRNFIGIEKDDKYFDIAVSRIKGTEPNPNNLEKAKERGLFSFTDDTQKAD
ncbi:MAG: site-specific DNA-methyltransferase [Bacteroidetes bacterium]|nr:site-specific DNA-methyltransferase [Bacteroidota bacterium]